MLKTYVMEAMVEFKENLEGQLSEIELLQSMFPSHEEFSLDDPQSLSNVERYLSGNRNCLPNQISFTINIPTKECKECAVLLCSFPMDYPAKCKPALFVRSNFASRDQQRSLNDELRTYVESLPQGDLCLSLAVMWIQENWANYVNSSNDDVANPGQSSTDRVKQQKFTGLSRLWIYSHHIYRKELLKKIPESAKELDVTGFMLPGKPGIICVEGLKENCDDYWQRLKYPNWKHISCKHREDLEIDADLPITSQLENFRLFPCFEKLAFEAHGDYGLRNDYHMDLGQFRHFLEEHKCEYMFQLFFGLEAKSSSQ